MFMEDNITNAAKFNSFKDKARKLIHDDAVNDAKIIKERAKDRAAFLNKTVNDTSGFEGLMPSYSQSTSAPTQLQESYDEVGAHGQSIEKSLNDRMEALNKKIREKKGMNSKSGLPMEILESFGKTDIDYEKLDPNQSVLDLIGVEAKDNIKKNVIKETTSNNSSDSNVDYSLIKSIVENAVKKYVGGYTKKLLEEGKKTQVNDPVKAIKIGDKFSFITENGDIYEAKLVFKKNINK